MRLNSQKYSLFFVLFAVLIAANLFVPSESLCKKCRKNKATNKGELEETFGEKDEKTHVNQPDGQPKKEPSSEESEEKEAAETTPTPLAPKRSRRDHELRRDKELGEIATFTGGQRKVAPDGHDGHDHRSHNNANHRNRKNYYYTVRRRRQAEGALNAVGADEESGAHAGHAHASDASCDASSSEEGGGGGAKLDAETKVGGAARKRRHALNAHSDAHGQRGRAVDTTVFEGPDSSQTDDAAGAPILVRKPRSYNHDKWHCPRDAEEEILRMAEKSENHKHHEKREAGEPEVGEDSSANVALKYPPGVDLREFMARKMDERSHQPTGPFPGHRRGPVGPFPEPDLHHHYGHDHTGPFPKFDGGLIANRHFNLEEAIRRRQEAHAQYPENSEGHTDQRRAREMDETLEEPKKHGKSPRDSSEDEEGYGPRTHRARELGEEVSQPRAHARRARGVDSDQYHVDEGVGLNENIRRKLESDLHKKKWLIENKQNREREAHQEKSGRSFGIEGDSNSAETITPALFIPHIAVKFNDEQEVPEILSRSPRSSDVHLGQDVRRKLESDLNRSGRAGEGLMTQGTRDSHHHHNHHQGHHDHRDHQHPTGGNDGDELRLGENVRLKLESDLNRAGRAGDPNV